MDQTIAGYRLSPQQKRLWTLQQQGLAYHAQCAILLEGELQTADLEEALRRTVAQEEILRTSFRPLPQLKTPVQVVADQGELLWRTCQLAAPAVDVDFAVEQPAEIERLLEEEAQLLSRTTTQLRAVLTKFTSAKITSAKITSDRHLLLLTLPALCADSLSLHNLMRHLARSYAQTQSADAAADEGLVQYVQFSEWQNELLEDEEPAGRLWWQQALSENSAALVLPFERQGSRGRTEAVAQPESRSVVERRLNEADVTAVDGLTQATGKSAAVFLFACWQVLLWRLSQQSEFYVSYVCDGRKYEELRDALGLFAKAVPVAGQLAEGMSFNQLLDQVAEVTTMAYAWQESYDWQQNGAGADQASGPSSSAIGFEYTERRERAFERGVAFSIHQQSHRLEKFKLQLSCARTHDSIVAELNYDPDYFDAEAVERLGGQFTTLVRSALASPQAHIDELEILTAAERQQLLYEWNQTSTENDYQRLVHELFEEQVERTPHRLAVVCGDEQLTYAELNARANRLANMLQRSGARAETPIALCLERSTEMLVGLIGILKAGYAYVPLDPEHPPTRLALQLAEIQAPILVTQATLVDRLPEFNGETICLDRDRARLDGEHAPLDGEDDANLPPSTSPQNLCYVIYTSGSTGSPKGVAVTHQNLVNYALFICSKLQLRDSPPLHFATVSTLSADLGNTCIFPALISGGCLHVLKHDVVMDSEKFTQYLATHSCDVLKIVPSHLAALLATAEGETLLPRKFLLLGGEQLTHELLRKIAEVGGSYHVINHYGPTETTVGSLTFDVSDSVGFQCGARSVPIGRPIANTQAYVLDRHLQPAPVGVPGELYIGGAGVARGYLNKPVQTAERFITHVFAAGDESTRLYKTGDLTRRLVDGSIEFLGRVDNQVKIRGHRIELGEIEATLQRHEDVRQAVVLAREDEPGHKRLVAYIVASGERAPSVAQLRAFLGESLPEYMIPAAFVTNESLPLTRNGKIDRAALPAPDQTRPELPNRFAPARNPVEEKLMEIWKEVLRVERVGVNDNFFELGGDSILSLQIIARARRVGLRLVPKQLFEFPTIALLAPVTEQIEIVQDDPELLTEIPVAPNREDRTLTPSDFPEAALSQKELDNFLGGIELD
jgi:amino acid adenylation domain-containing protein